MSASEKRVGMTRRKALKRTVLGSAGLLLACLIRRKDLREASS